MGNATISGAIGPSRNPHNLLVNSDGYPFGIPVYLGAGAVDLNDGENYGLIFAHAASVVTITSSLYDTSGTGSAPTSINLPAGSYYACPGATRINQASGETTAYKSIIHGD